MSDSHLALSLLIREDINEFSDARASFRTGFYPFKSENRRGKKRYQGNSKAKQRQKRSAFLFGLSPGLRAASAEFHGRTQAACNGFVVDVMS